MALWILTVLLTGCSGCGLSAPTPLLHYQQAQGIYEAVAAGDLPLAQELALEMDGGELSSSQSLPLDYQDSVHAALGFLLASEDTTEASDAVAGIGAACGGCHASIGLASGPDQPGLDGVWQALWRGQRQQAFELARVCALSRGQVIGAGRVDTAGELDVQGAFAELLVAGRSCAPGR